MHEFIAMLAHELRNPLAPIRNAVELMGRKGLQDPVLESMRQTIDRQSALLTRIIDEFLDVNRIARGKFSINMETVDLAAVLSRAIETTRPLIDAQGQHLEVDVRPGELWLKGDSLRLTQVIVNLLNNSAKFTPSGGRISLKVERRGTDVEIRVRDNGRGIDPDHLESIFDLFTQISPESVRDQGGSGSASAWFGASSSCTAAWCRRAAKASGTAASSSCACRSGSSRSRGCRRRGPSRAATRSGCACWSSTTTRTRRTACTCCSRPSARTW